MNRPPLRPPGFTLIEIMIALSIAAIVFAMGVPAIFRAVHKDPLRQGLSDLMQAFDQARGDAILRDVPTAVQFNLLDGGVWEVVVRERSAAERNPLAAVVAADNDPGEANGAGMPAAGRIVYRARLSDQLRVELLAVNFKDAIADQEPPAPVWFYPDGTCDEFTLVLRWPDTQEWRKISLDVITGFPKVEIIR